MTVPKYFLCSRLFVIQFTDDLVHKKEYCFFQIDLAFESFCSGRIDIASKDNSKASQSAVRHITSHITDGRAASTIKESLSERMKRLNDKFGPSGNPEGRSAPTIQGQSIVHISTQGRFLEDLKEATELCSKDIETGVVRTSHQDSRLSKQLENACDGNEETTDDDAESIDCNSPIIDIKEHKAESVSLNIEDEKSQESPILWINTGKARKTGNLSRNIFG